MFNIINIKQISVNKCKEMMEYGLDRFVFLHLPSIEAGDFWKGERIPILMAKNPSVQFPTCMTKLIYYL